MAGIYPKAIIFTAISFVILCSCCLGAGVTGRVLYHDLSPAPATVVYLLGRGNRLEVFNNSIMVSEHVPRAITDMQGMFKLKKTPANGAFLLAIDMDDQLGFATVFVDGDSLGDTMIQDPSSIRGRLLKGDKGVKAKKVTATYMEAGMSLIYRHSRVTDSNGVFEFEGMLPGKYLLNVVEDVPQVGCCFNQVVTKQLRTRLEPGAIREIKLGGTDLPFLKGKVTDTKGKGLHGVWVILEPKVNDKFGGVSGADSAVVWSEVTARDGSYEIYDIPPGSYTLHCFRRLLLNDAGRTLQANRDVVVLDREKGSEKPVQSRFANNFDFAIDVESFKPLAYGIEAPQIAGKLLDGSEFELSKCKGRIVVLYFYASWCSGCAGAGPGFNNLAQKYSSDNVMVVGISIDEDIDLMRKYVIDKGLKFNQLFSGPWSDSDIRKAYRVINVPTSFIIDTKGNIAQRDLFGGTLDKYIDKLLKDQ